MPSIGKIVVKRIIEHKLLPPVYEQIVKGPAPTIKQWQHILHLIAPSLVGAGGESPKPHKEVLRFITQNVAVSAGTVNRVKTSGVVGISYTQTSFTFESYTIGGVAVAKTLSQSITITEPLSVQRRKGRRLFEDSPQFTDLSATVSIRRTKTRAALAESTIISETLTAQVTTQTVKVLTETNSINELLARLKALKRSELETVSESGDVTITLPGARKTLTESVALSDAVVFEVTHAGGTNITKTLSDTIDLSESITRRSTTARTVLESIALADSLNLTLRTVRSYSSSFSVISYTSSYRPTKALTETVQESHTLRMALTKKRSVPVQSATIGDAVTALVTRARAADIVPITEEVTRAVGRSKQLGDTVIISDNLTSTLADVVPITDQVTRVVGRTRALIQSINIVG